MKKTVIGILAHVDAGKTTLSESMLYLSGSIRKLGRVDHGDTFLDYNELEKQRGITIFSKQAIFNWNDVEITLIDTPGHVDFSSEMERTLSILDYAIIVVNGLDGVQNHTKTIWKLLEANHIPTFIFMNKMDMNVVDKDQLMNDLTMNLNEYCIDFSSLSDEQYETIALLDEEILEFYLSHGYIENYTLRQYITSRKIFPVFFGSALKVQGVKEFLDGMTLYIENKQYPKEFGAKVFKITREDGNRLVHMKITGGELVAKQTIDNNEKIDRIMQYRGNKYVLLQSVSAGSICSVKGLKNIYAGDNLGIEKQHYMPSLSPYMNYQMILPEKCDYHTMVNQLKQLEEEDPQLHMQYNNDNQIITLSLMGEIQIEVLKKMIKDRFLVDVDFSTGYIIYKETIKNVVEGVGHYEPLRHYAEVHLLMEPLPRGSGLVFDVDCKEDDLAGNFQRLVLTHLNEKEHIGVLTGSPITDMKITLVNGKAHLKHTEGGDFRQATYRALRQGLKMSENILLEPYYQFTLEIPTEYLSKAIFDIESMNGEFTIEVLDNETNLIKGEAPIRKMQNYQLEVLNYTKGKGKLYCQLSGYKECQETSKVIKEIGYDSERDINNPTGSVFCSHGAGFNVAWNEVYDYMHLPLKIKKESKIQNANKRTYSNDDELQSIFERTYGPIKQKSKEYQQSLKKEVKAVIKPVKPKCLLVDGYNVIFSWDELKELANKNLDIARERLIDILSNYQGYINYMVIVVFDAYKVKGNLGSSEKYHNIYVVYTKEAQTADMYIERATHQMANDFDVIVATSDALEQIIVIGAGASRISSRQLILEVKNVCESRLDEFQSQQIVSRNYLLEDVKDYNKKG